MDRSSHAPVVSIQKAREMSADSTHLHAKPPPPSSVDPLADQASPEADIYSGNATVDPPSLVP